MAQSSRRICWCEADSKILVHKYVPVQLYLNCPDHIFRVTPLDLDVEKDIQWGELIDESWKKWTAHKLEERWGPPLNQRSAQVPCIAVSTLYISAIHY